MTNIVKAIVLGIVQGLTEFLPVSSSGHLKIFSQFGDDALQNNVAFDVAMHLATLLAVLIVFRSRYIDLIKSSLSSLKTNNFSLIKCYKECGQFRTGIFVILASVPTAVIGLLFKDKFENASLLAVGVSLIITSIILFIPKLLKKEGSDVLTLDWKFAVLLGIAQACAIMPGISRSGTTISVAILLGATRSFSGYFSFLIMIPAVAGASLLHLGDMGAIDPALLISGFAASFLSGLLALLFLLKLLDRGKFHYFSPYCLLVGLAVIISQLV